MREPSVGEVEVTVNGSNALPQDGSLAALGYVWPEQGLARVPDWVYTSEEIYAREVERIFQGPTWNFVGLEAEIATPGAFKRSFAGPTPVVVARAQDGSIHVFENRCAHRGAEFCRPYSGKTNEFICPYHQWTYDLSGRLIGVPFRRGLKRRGGMPASFKLEEHGLRRLKVATRGGVVFASFDPAMEPLEDYLGPEILADFDATFDGRKLKVLGYYRNSLPANWKMYHENLKDPYHATLLHTYLVSFGLLVAGNKSAMIVDPKGRHGTMASAKGEESAAVDQGAKSEMRAFHEGLTLADGRILDYVKEFSSPWSVTMQTIWPNMIVQRELNTLGTRQIVPQGPDKFVMIWTMFGFAGDSDEMTRHRLRQGNLMGPAGFLGLEDNEAMKFVQDGLRTSLPSAAVIELGGSAEGTSPGLISEAAIRALYRHWREVMEL
jgi:phenylpropionate dioxygenase-like ring-hydroxylating dioxygenase large terminal subunit